MAKKGPVGIRCNKRISRVRINRVRQTFLVGLILWACVLGETELSVRGQEQPVDDKRHSSSADGRTVKLSRTVVDRFHGALILGNVDLTQSLLLAHPRLANRRDKDGYPPLHLAARFAHVNVARILLKRGADVNARDRYGTTAIFHAESKEMAQLLIDAGAKLKLTADDERQTPMTEAVSGGYLEVVKVFIQSGEELDFDAAVTLGMTDRVNTMLKEKPWLAKSPGKPLHSAAREGNLNVCKLLLEHGADPNLDFGFDNVTSPYTPLSAAVTSEHYEIAKLLLEHGAKPNASADSNHDNLFVFAIAYLDARYAKLMLQHGANVHAVEQLWGAGITPLHVAAALGGAKDVSYGIRVTQPNIPSEAQNPAFEKVQLLVEFGADINKKTDDGSTPLLFAAIAGHRQVCEFLIEKGAVLDIYSDCLLGRRTQVDEMLKANPNLATAKQHPLGRPLLHWAARAEDLALVDQLLKLRADANEMAPQLYFQDAGGFSTDQFLDGSETPIQVAVRNGHEDIVRMLIEHGARLDSTPFALACSRGYDPVAKLLLNHGVKVDSVVLESALESEGTTVFPLVLNAVDKNVLTQEVGARLLRSAAQKNRSDAVELLLARGVKPDIFTLSILGRIHDIRKLVDADPTLVNAQERNNPRESVIVLATHYGRADVVDLLISKGAEIGPEALGGKSLLHEAAEGGHQKVIDLLLERGMKLDQRDEGGDTLLHVAASGAQPEIVQFLLSKGASAQAVDYSQESPLHRMTGFWSSSHQRGKTDPEVIERNWSQLGC